MLKIILVIIIAIIITIFIYCVSNENDRVANIVLALTGEAIVWYTIETSCLRHESEIANRRSAKPILLFRFREENTPAFDKLAIYLKNSGPGTATNIRWHIKDEKDQLADRKIFERGFNRGLLPNLWPESGFLLTVFKRDEYRKNKMWKWVLVIEYDWDFGKNEKEILNLDLDYYVSTDVSGDLRKELSRAWVEQATEQINKETRNL